MNLPRTVPWVLAAAGLTLGCGGPVDAQDGHAAEAALEPIAWLTGGTWYADARTPAGEPLTIAVTFERTAGGKAIAYQVTTILSGRSTTTHTGLYHWDPETERVALLQVDDQANLSRAIVRAGETSLTQEITMTRPDGSVQAQRAELLREGADAYLFRAQLRRDGSWVDAASLRYRRIRDRLE